MRIINLQASIIAPVLIATSKEGSFVEPLRIKVQDKYPVYVIPSTSWRGVFRTMSLWLAPYIFEENTFEGYVFRKHHQLDLRILNNDQVKALIDDILNRSLQEIREEVEKTSRATRSKSIEKLKEEDAFEALNITLNMTCPLERLYGSNYSASKIIFLDTYLPKASLRYLTHVGIDRKKGVKKERALFVEGSIVKPERFEIFIIDHTKEDTPERKLLEGTLDAVKELGIHVGSSKSRGLGFIKIVDIKTVKNDDLFLK